MSVSTSKSTSQIHEFKCNESVFSTTRGNK